MPQIVFPPDTRRRVDDTTSYPWSTVGQLIMQFPNGRNYSGTATLIDRSHLLTAAHNVFGNDVGGWATNVWFARSRDGDETPAGFVPATRAFITEEYYTLSPPNPNDSGGNVREVTLYIYDYAVVRLSDPLPPPIMGMYAAGTPELARRARITGYPGDKVPANTMWTDTGPMEPEDLEHFLFYRINTFQGESGAAIVADLPLPVGKSIVGVHVAGDPELETNFGVRLSSEVLDNVRAWMNTA